jgi:hypothetical protein
LRFILTFLFGTNWLTRRTLGLYFSIVGAMIALNFLLIPTMSYYGSACDNCRLWKHDVYFLPGEQILSYSLRFKENRRLSRAIHTFFQYHGFRENYYVGISLLIVFLYFIYHNEKK